MYSVLLALVIGPASYSSINAAAPVLQNKVQRIAFPKNWGKAHHAYLAAGGKKAAGTFWMAAAKEEDGYVGLYEWSWAAPAASVKVGKKITAGYGDGDLGEEQDRKVSTAIDAAGKAAELAINGMVPAGSEEKRRQQCDAWENTYKKSINLKRYGWVGVEVKQVSLDGRTASGMAWSEGTADGHRRGGTTSFLWTKEDGLLHLKSVGVPADCIGDWTLLTPDGAMFLSMGEKAIAVGRVRK